MQSELSLQPRHQLESVASLKQLEWVCLFWRVTKSDMAFKEFTLITKLVIDVDQTTLLLKYVSHYYTKTPEPTIEYFHTEFTPLKLNYWIKFMVDMDQII